MGQAPLRDEAGESGQQAEIHGDRRWLRTRRRRRCRNDERARLQREVLLLPGFAAAGAQHRCAGRNQRRQELPERRRQRPAPLLRHGEGRGLPRAGGERLPPGRGERPDHRPVRRAGRAVRPRVRRPPGQPLVRRRAGVADLLRSRANRAAAAARRLPGAGEGNRGRGSDDVSAHRDARSRCHRRTGTRHRGTRHGHRQDRVARRRRGGARHRRLRQRVLPLHQRQGLERHGDLAGVQAGRRLRQSVLHSDPPDLHPGERRVSVEAHADERVTPERWPRLGAQG